MNVTVIGLGLIGGSIAKDLRKSGFATAIIGVDSNSTHGEKAKKIGLVDQVLPLEAAVGKADLVVIAIPVDKIKLLLPQVLDLVSDRTTVADMGSTKKELCDVVENHPKRRNYVPAHPMSGTENSGPDAALEGLFSNKIAIICDHEKSGPQHLALIEKMFQSMGMDIAYMSADEQDHSTAFISHLPHAAAYALANAVQDKEDRSIIFDLASGGFRSTVRLAKSAPSMWGPIFQQNKSYVVESLEVYIKHLIDFKDSIQRDEKRMYELMNKANNIRSILGGENSSLIKNEEKIVKFYTK
ncbi:prephenate dehydrogenase [uncultured Sunxiuqinia sp.]|uniref:prephenate dehydrogenase n=1 Tax=uncultured Sunxiuqinia sp. TaxID=1573825 RepID=UPI001998D453|nr:prephenate dehydrogenase [Sunxiuqinia sp.]|tara:strand:+ start:24161 stop:25054 length:894 start_codon:yes stop_codon:yes gene_type:complete